MERTTNYNLKKPELEDASLITDLSDNMDTLDAQLKQVSDTASGAASGLTEEAAARAAAITALDTDLQTQITALARHVVTTANTDLDDYRTDGRYFFSNDYTPAHVPSGNTNGTLIVLSQTMNTTPGDVVACKQLWLRAGSPGTNSYQVYERSRNNNGWSSWVRFLTTSDTLISGAASTVVTENLTGNRALVSNSSGKIAVLNEVTATELGYLDGVTSPIQTQLGGKQETVTGAASTITGSDLTENRALISNNSGKVAVSTVTQSELYQLTGINTNQTLQAQLDGKLAGSGYTNTNRIMIVDGSGAARPYTEGPTTEQVYALRNIDTTQTIQQQLDNKAPSSHQSSTGGVNAYGHVKLRDSLDANAYTSGEALSSYQGAVLKAMIEALTTASALSSGVNLNSYTTPGHYYAANAAAAGGITNSPTTASGYTLHVFPHGASGCYQQAEDNNGNVYTRVLPSSGGSWTGWKTLA